jgi:hypothetical protein
VRLPTALLAVVLGAAPVHAQFGALSLPPEERVPSLGILAGVNSTSLGGRGAGALDRRTGVAGGVAATFPIGRGALSLRPELLYSQKGAGGRQEVGPDFIDARIELTYFELPVLLQYTVATQSTTVRPQIYVGPALGLRAACRVRITARIEDTPVDGATDCGDTDVLTGAEGDDDTGFAPRRFDVGAVVGAALAFAVRGRTASVGVRYTHGLSRLVSDVELYNRTLFFYAGLDFPVARGPR